MLPMALVLVIFALVARDSPRRHTPATLDGLRCELLREPDTLSLSLLYA